MSTKLMTALSECPIDLGSTVGLNPVCIDNQDIRKRLLKNGKIEVSAVPCVLIVYRTGEVEKYEGNAAFQWIDEAVSKYAPPPPPPKNEIRSPPPQKKEASVKRRPVIEKYEEEEEEEIEYISAPEPPKKVKHTQKSKKQTTSVDDLSFEDFSLPEETIQKSIVKGKDLLSAAAAMQKERDAGDSNKTKIKGSV